MARRPSTGSTTRSTRRPRHTASSSRSRCAIARCVTRSSSARSRAGRRGRRRRSWSACSWSPRGSPRSPSRPPSRWGVHAGAGRVCWTAHRPRAARPKEPPPKDPTPMASTPPNPASLSDDDPGIPLGVRVQRQGATGPAGQPGTIRVVALKGGQLDELEGADALAKLPDLLRKPDCSAWVDLVAPTPTQAAQVGEALGLHPLIIEDVLEGNQRAKIETTDGIVHIVLFHLNYGEVVVASELDVVLGEGFLLTVH